MSDNRHIPVTKSPTLVPKMELPNETLARWNTTNLGLRIAADGASAATASAMVAPIICVIDKAIVQKAATGAPITRSLHDTIKPALLRPYNFITSRPFLLIFSLYFSTYFTANSIDTATSTVSAKPSDSVTASGTKFVATSAVNMSMCVYKDSQFARMFGSSSSPAVRIPKLSYALFATRDCMTIFASFNLPHLIAPKLAELPTSVKEKFSRILSTEAGRSKTAQFLAPAAMQLFSTPIHLFGLDLYNRQGRLGFAARFSRVTRDWGVSAFARMGRIIPAFGVGGVVNAEMRKNLMGTME
ncbi:hypothetical protein R6Q59_009907 [Mikania micrantha]